MQIREGYSVSNCFTDMVNKVVNTATNFSFGCCFTKVAVAVEVPMVEIDAAAYASDIESSNFEVGVTYTTHEMAGQALSKSRRCA